MQYTKGVRRSILVTILIAVPVLGMGGSWESELQDGSRVRVDPNTNRGTVVTPNGARTQLWDGVHRLRDGSEITVRSGVVVPNKEILDVQRGLPPSRAMGKEEGGSPCLKLMHSVCGPGDECADQPECTHARQLVQFEKEEKEDNVPGFEQAPQQCRDALKQEDYFKPCLALPTPCQELVAKVCGTSNQCAEQPACEPAKQLLGMEKEEQLSSLDTTAKVPSSDQCQAALQDEEFFAVCTP